MLKKKGLYILGAGIGSLLLIGCGGGGSNPPTQANTTTQQMSVLSGTVPGTLIEAFCKDGSYYKTTSTKDGTSQHPFKLSIPTGLDCKIIMTTNEDKDISQQIITPLKFSSDGVVSTTINLNGDTDIGYVPLATTGSGIKFITITVSSSKIEIKELKYDPLDIDKDGIPNIYEDDDSDGIYNKYDDDKDGDGIDDSQDPDYKNDKDGDGIDDEIDKDDDNDGHEDDDNKNSQTTTTTLPTSFKADEGRLLAANCAQCHGTNGVSTNDWDSIAGEKDLLEEFYEDEHPLMSAIAHGFNRDEVAKMGSWLSTLSKGNDKDNDKDDDNDD